MEVPLHTELAAHSVHTVPAVLVAPCWAVARKAMAEHTVEPLVAGHPVPS